MQYCLLVYESEKSMNDRTDPELKDAYWGAYSAYSAALREAGILVGGNGLLPPDTATTVRIRNGDRQVQDGPFADTKELLGGYFVIDVKNLDEAMAWAARCPGAEVGAMEIRPVMTQ